MNTNASRGIQPGGITILVIFTVLCLAIFSALSLGSVRADARFSERYASLTTRYYEADALAESWLGQSDRQLRALAEKNSAEPLFWEAVAGEFGAQFDPQSRQITFEAPVSDTQALRVRVQLAYAEAPVEQILCWTTVSTMEVTFDESLQLWDGGEMGM